MDHTAAMRSAAGALHASLGLCVANCDFLAAWRAAHERYYSLYLEGRMTYEEARRARIRQTIRLEITDSEADKLFGEYLARYEAAWSLFPDVLPCLDRLSSCRMGII
jgi:putative hydrolase of the HAD superfamily